jgi:carbohydrate-selective porin OprB
MLLHRDTDVLGPGTTAVHFSSASNTRNDYELAIELFYRLRFTPFVSLKSDLQYIVHPEWRRHAADSRPG